MDESEAVENLKRSGRTEYFRCHILLEEGICQQAESRADALSTDFHHVPQRIIQSMRLFCKFQIFKQILYGVFDMIFGCHRYCVFNIQI